MRWLTDVEYASVVEQGNSSDAQRAVVMTVAQTDGVKPAVPVALPPKAEDAPKAKKVKAPVDADEEPEVRKEAAKPSAVPAKKGSLADIVDDWDDE